MAFPTSPTDQQEYEVTGVGTFVYTSATNSWDFQSTTPASVRSIVEGSVYVAPTVADNDGSFDLSAATHFTWTPAAADELTFTNISVGLSGTIKLVNTTPYAITIDATTVEAPTDAATEMSTAGTYIISYVVPNGETKALIEVSRALS